MERTPLPTFQKKVRRLFGRFGDFGQGGGGLGEGWEGSGGNFGGWGIWAEFGRAVGWGEARRNGA